MAPRDASICINAASASAGAHRPPGLEAMTIDLPYRAPGVIMARYKSYRRRNLFIVDSAGMGKARNSIGAGIGAAFHEAVIGRRVNRGRPGWVIALADHQLAVQRILRFGSGGDRRVKRKRIAKSPTPAPGPSYLVRGGNQTLRGIMAGTMKSAC